MQNPYFINSSVRFELLRNLIVVSSFSVINVNQFCHIFLSDMWWTDRKEAGTLCFLLTSQYSVPIAQDTGFILSSSFIWCLQIKLSPPNSSPTSFSLASLNYSDSNEAINWDMTGIKSSSSAGDHEVFGKSPFQQRPILLLSYWHSLISW